MLSLLELLSSFSESTSHWTQAVARGEKQIWNRRDFLIRTRQFQRLAERHSAQIWGLFLSSSFEFAACFLGFLQAGKEPVILPNCQPQFLARLAGDIDAFFCDVPDESANILGLEYLPAADEDFEFQILKSEQLLALYTSGSTGEPKKVVKTLANLDSELRTLEDVWGDLIGESVSLATVSHQHIYGLLFQVLWPLCSGRVFETEIYHFPSDLLERMKTSQRVVLISSPAHLNRIHRLADLRPQAEKLSALFSSGGPLERTASLDLGQTLEQRVIEVFGSTETGGVAHRRQGPEPESMFWTPFSVVEIEIDEKTSRLCLSSPYIDSPSPYLMEDKIKLQAGGRFELLGRCDRVQKIEGKRVSLDEVESRLKGSEYVRDARAIVLSENRRSIGVVFIPSKRGKELVDKGGKTELTTVLKAELASYFERVLLPRKWRVVEEFPVNAQGKTTQDKLKMVFAQEKIEKPLVLSVEQSELCVVLSLSVREKTRYFDGHFPGHPILPGIAQVDWAAEFAQQYFQLADTFSGLEALKFPEFIGPGSQVTLTLNYRPEKKKVNFSFTGENKKFSSGRIVFGGSS